MFKSCIINTTNKADKWLLPTLLNNLEIILLTLNSKSAFCKQQNLFKLPLGIFPKGFAVLVTLNQKNPPSFTCKEFSYWVIL